ncbi:YceI family protein [Campylobacter subantarcticus]|uniref:Putative periplasmic protein (YceI-like domain) n=1 Tax=Campylobacter subantarcticus LMG 24374 TaxID=1388751 RepID=A0A0A8HCJ6_9BACT|nr:YceI family protein [Campylobacter subantarcticus]AJC90624.1 putative periplasmic protein (YceI-like domain) [Campylobacter subantarcticus LMG 24374]EAJ1260698.1 polyisoprenoid-binding protein [Campylobacter lari]
MKKILFGSFLAASILTSSALSKEFSLDKAHTNVAFKIKHLQISNVNGNFKEYEAVIDFDSAKFEFNKLQANIKVASINTENKARDAHLQQDDFFKAKNHPNITFTMSKYEKISDEKGKMHGVLNIAGVSKDIVLETEIGGVIKTDGGKEKAGFTLQGQIKRSDFNFAPDTTSLTLGDEVQISIEAEINEK